MIRNRTNRPARGGFTLVELLTVVAILALLAAIVAGVVGTVRTSQTAKATEDTLSKLHTALDAQRKALADKCRKDRTSRTPEFTAVTAFCGGDEDRAEALWVLLNMKKDFPMTVAEATNPVGIPGVVTLQPRLTFRTTTAAAAGTPFEQSAVLLYLNLSEKAIQGVDFQADLVASGEQNIGGTNFRVFRDSWGLPIGFSRQAQNAELETADYVKPGTTYHDPYDAKGRLGGTWTNKATALAALNANLQATDQVTFDGRNRMLTAFSGGPNKSFQGIAASLASDDLFSYRARKQGARVD